MSLLGPLESKFGPILHKVYYDGHKSDQNEKLCVGKPRGERLIFDGSFLVADFGRLDLRFDQGGEDHPGNGDKNVIDEGLTIDVLNDAAYLARTNIPNDSSVLLKAITKQENVLFCQDIGGYGDELIVDPWIKKENGDCLFLQTAHHGLNGASEPFYQCYHDAKIAPFEACYPQFDDNSKGKDPGSGLWSSLKTRGWMRKFGIRYYFMIEETMFE